MSDVIGIAVEKWSHETLMAAIKWLKEMYGDACFDGIESTTGKRCRTTWYRDFQPMCEDLVMRKDIYFMFVAAFGEDYGTTN